MTATEASGSAKKLPGPWSGCPRSTPLVDICRFWLDHGRDTSISGGERPHITVTAPYATLTVGHKTRTVTPPIRRALQLRDRGCAWAGCGAPVYWCDAHHIIHWAHGGVTALTNLTLLCRRHHTATHNGKHPPDP